MEALAKMPEWMSLDEFLACEPGDGQKWQLVDGQPQAMALTKRSHRAIIDEIARLIGNHLAEHRPNCNVIDGPGVVPPVQSKASCRIPDLAVTCSSYDDDEATLNNPVLLIENLSPSNRAEIWSNVWTYTMIPSVQGILIVKSESMGGDLLRRGADESWPEKPETVTEGELYLSRIDFVVPIAGLYHTIRFASSSGG